MPVGFADSEERHAGSYGWKPAEGKGRRSANNAEYYGYLINTMHELHAHGVPMRGSPNGSHAQ